MAKATIEERREVNKLFHCPKYVLKKEVKTHAIANLAVIAKLLLQDWPRQNLRREER